MRKIDWYVVALWLLVLVPVALLFRDWLFSLKPLVAGDWPYMSAQTMADFWPPRHGWIAYEGIGMSATAWLPDFFVQLLNGAAALVHVPFEVYERVFFCIPAVVAGIVGPYALALELTNSKIAGIVAGAAAIFNGYWTRLATIGQLDIMLADGLLALFVLLFLKLMRDVSAARCVGMIALFAALLTVDLRIAFVAALLGALMGAGYLAAMGIRRAAPGLIAIAGSCAAALVFLNAAWVVPSLYYRHLEPALPAGYDLPFWLDVLSFFTLPQSLALYHQWHLPVLGAGFPPAALFALLLALMLAPIILSPRKPWVVAFTLILLTFAFLMKGTRPPFGELNAWLFQHAPGMYAFRDPSKFAGVIVVARAVLIGYAVVLLGRLAPRVARLLPMAAIAIIVIADGYAFSPALSGSFHVRDVPADSTAVNSLITSDAGFSRVLWLPRRSYFSVRTRLHPMVEALADNPTFLSEYTGNNDENAAWPLGWMEHPSAGWVVRDLGVDRIVVPSEDTDEQAFTIGWTPRARLSAMVRHAPWLAFDRRIGGIDLYRVTQPRALITASSAAIALPGGSLADLRHLENAQLPAGTADAPVFLLPSNAAPLPATIEVLSTNQPPGPGAARVSRLLYGGRVLATRAAGPHDAGLVGVQPHADGSLTLPADRSFFPTDLSFEQPPAGPDSSVTFAVRLKPDASVRSVGIVLFCNEDLLTRSTCADGYALQWRSGGASLLRYYRGTVRTLASSPVPLRMSQWHTLSLTVHHPDIATQRITATLDGASLAYVDSGFSILYTGRTAVTTAGGAVELDPRHFVLTGTGGDWAAPIFLSLQSELAPGAARHETSTEAVLPIGIASALVRVPLLDADVIYNRGLTTRTGCGLSSVKRVSLPLDAPVFGRPLLSWRLPSEPRSPSTIVLYLRDGQGAHSCIAIPVDVPARSVDVESYIALQTAAGVFAPRPPPRRDEYALRFPRSRAHPADDYVVTGIGMNGPAAFDAVMHVSLDINRSALDREIAVADPGRAASRGSAMTAACAAFAGLPYSGRWSPTPRLLMTTAREIQPGDIPRADELLAAPAFSVGVSTPASAARRGHTTMRHSAADSTGPVTVLQFGTCVYQPYGRRTQSESRVPSSAPPAPLSQRPAGVLVATHDLLRIRTLAVRFAQVGDLHYQADVPVAPAWVVFRQGYDAGWVARGGASVLMHALADGLFNAYYVGTPGRIDIEFAPRPWAIAGEIISIASALTLCIVALWLLLKRRA